MVASDKNEDIVAPILRPDLNDEDMKEYVHIASQLEIDPSLKDNESYMQFMNYNQICYLEVVPTHGSTSDEKPLPINNDWPAIAHEAPGHPLVTKGVSFFHSARKLYFEAKDPNGKRLIDEFLEIYKNRPDKVNLCGIRINHALALFLAIKEINPTLVVESGVNAGQSTYFIRAASPTTRIFAIDPEEEAICNQGKRWLDDSPLTTNYTGKNFKDLLDFDWKGMIERKEVDPDKTLIFLDDHLHTYDRIQSIAKTGLKKVLVEDNYKIGEGKLI